MTSGEAPENSVPHMGNAGIVLVAPPEGSAYSSDHTRSRQVCARGRRQRSPAAFSWASVVQKSERKFSRGKNSRPPQLLKQWAVQKRLLINGLRRKNCRLRVGTLICRRGLRSSRARVARVAPCAWQGQTC